MTGPVRFRGQPVDAQSRCVHWNGPTDIVAFRFACCEGWWPCHACHEETAGHVAVPWPVARFGEPSVLCGACGLEMAASDYTGSGSRCPHYSASFNPRCKPHWPLYFEQPCC